MALLEDVVSAVANENFKVVASAVSAGMAQAGQLSMLNATANQQIATQNATSHQQELNMLSKAALAETILQRAGIDISEAVAAKKITEADLSRSVGELGAAIAALQQIMKGAQTTRPETGAG